MTWPQILFVYALPLIVLGYCYVLYGMTSSPEGTDANRRVTREANAKMAERLRSRDPTKTRGEKEG